MEITNEAAAHHFFGRETALLCNPLDGLAANLDEAASAFQANSFDRACHGPEGFSSSSPPRLPSLRFRRNT
jgi:hypothetical protein